MVLFIEAIPATFRKLRKNWHYIPLALFFDIITLLFFSLGKSVIRDLSSTPFLSLVDITAAFTPILSSVKFAVMGTESFTTSSLIAIVLLLVPLFYAIWLLFNGPSWYLAHKMNEEPLNQFFEPKFFLKFGIISATWFFLGFIVVAGMVKLTTILFLNPLSWLSIVDVQHIMNTVNVVFFYFLFLSFALVSVDRFHHNFKKTIVYGVRKVFTFIAMFGLISLVIFGGSWLASFLVEVPLKITSGTVLPVTLSSIFLAPFFLWVRMYLLVVVKKATK